ncbi:MAG TPA: CAP domain-containing protein [Chitinophagaceae bacterium]|nr:CAP domain-containing protein [Chitinophagaceae bacterium]
MLSILSFLLMLLPGKQTDTVDKQKMLELVNKVRQTGCKCGNMWMPPVASVTWNDQLAQVALGHSADMNAKNYFSHTSKAGKGPGDRLRAAGYTWKSIGENIGYNYPDEEAVIAGWLKSMTHCRTLMSKAFREMGVGRAGPYWTQLFATK